MFAPVYRRQDLMQVTIKLMQTIVSPEDNIPREKLEAPSAKMFRTIRSTVAP
jgi:hypothetical protein